MARNMSWYVAHNCVCLKSHLGEPFRSYWNNCLSLLPCTAHKCNAHLSWSGFKNVGDPLLWPSPIITTCHLVKSLNLSSWTPLPWIGIKEGNLVLNTQHMNLKNERLSVFQKSGKRVKSNQVLFQCGTGSISGIGWTHVEEQGINFQVEALLPHGGLGAWRGRSWVGVSLLFFTHLRGKDRHSKTRWRARDKSNNELRWTEHFWQCYTVYQSNI